MLTYFFENTFVCRMYYFLFPKNRLIRKIEFYFECDYKSKKLEIRSDPLLIECCTSVVYS